MRVGFLVLCAAFSGAAACGVVKDALKGPGGGAGGKGSSNPTVTALLRDGISSYATLVPELPTGFSQAEGVAMGALGQPETGSVGWGGDLSASASVQEFSSLLAESKRISAWGFSETRRLELLVQGLLAPVFDALGRNQLFTRGDANGVLPQEANLAPASASLFETLLSMAQFSVKMPAGENLPSHLVLGGTRDGKGVKIVGVWPEGKGFRAGFSTEIQISADEKQSFSFALAPGRMPGLVKSWTASSCEDDTISITLSRDLKTGSKSLSLKSRECPTGRNALGVLSLTFTSGKTLVEAAFAQNFENLTGPRKLFGTRQGFVLQAAATGLGDDSRLAAALALAEERDFSRPLADLFANFSISSLLTRYGKRAYLDPLAQTLAGSVLCSGASAAAAAGAETQAVADACDPGSDISPDYLVSAVDVLRESADTVGATDTEKQLGALAAVLAVKNSVFVSGKTTVYGKVPEPRSEFETLEGTRAQLSTLSLASLGQAEEAWAEGTLPTYASEEKLPGVAFRGLDGAIGEFMKEKCGSLVGEALKKAGAASGTSVSACP